MDSDDPPPSLSHGLLPLPSNTPKRRSLSDSTPTLDPSPKFIEAPRSRDNESLIATPTRLRRRVDLSARGLHLHMPLQDSYSSPGLGIQSGPQFEQTDSYGSPSSVLPRHSRGIDFARAATNLHHSTLAEQQSPDSSPVITQRQMFAPSRRGSTYAMMLDSPRVGAISGWGWTTPGNSDRGLSRSLGSTNPLVSEDSSSSSEDDADTLMDQDEVEQDAIIGTPQIRRSDDMSNITPYDSSRWSYDPAGPQNQSPLPGSFASYRRHIFGKRHNKHHREHPYHRNRTSSPEPSSLASNLSHNPSLFGQDPIMRRPSSRRESLSLGIGAVLHITSSNDDPADESTFGMTSATPEVVRRAVTRRSNLLPKTKNFARIRAALQEENSPVDSEFRRESEVVRQVRVNDVGLKKERSSTTPSSPDVTPSVRNMSNDGSEMSDIEAFGVKGGLGSSALPHHRRLSAGRWQQPRARSQTPPPALSTRYRSSSGMSEDNMLDSPAVSTPPSSVYLPATSILDPMTSMPSIEPSFPAMFQPPALPTAADMSRKINKRRRDDEFDINSFKRRAVSPGMSVQSSPVLGQSPTGWPARLSRENSVMGSGEDKPQSNSSVTGHPTPNFGPARVGLQGMTDTSETLMKMSID